MLFRNAHCIFNAGLLAFIPAAAHAQSAPQYKGLWEPVNYSEDIEFRDVFFVNGDVGWVAGAAGTIIHTKDGGTTWEAQLGGDPANSAERIHTLRFVDERHGWAVQQKKLLRTTDGESWEEIGTVPPGMRDLIFTTPLDGFATGRPGEVGGSTTMVWRTRDGGKTWQPHWECSGKITLAGLNRNISCRVQQFHFVTPRVGYAAVCALAMRCGTPPLIIKTEDGGETWTLMMGPGVVEKDNVTSIFFTDERTGFARLSSWKLHMTTDGGQTWRGLIAEPGDWLGFADPMVGWAYDITRYGSNLTYTIDGGKRWSARPLKFPASVYDVSFPRRDRAYVAGANGMVYRYSVVPASRALKPNELTSPAMPAFNSKLAEQAEQLAAIVKELTTALGGDAAGGAAKSSAATDASAAGPLNAPLPPPSQFTATCCAKSFSRLEAVLTAMAQTLPELIGNYHNLNLLLAGVRMSADLPAQYRTLKAGLGAFRTAENKAAAQAALAEASAALTNFRETADVALQKELPPKSQQ